MNIVLTGYKGFIGRNIHKALQEREDVDHIHLIEKEDFNQSPFLADIEDKIANSDVLLHIGANSNTLDFDLNKMMYDNFETSKLLFNMCLKHNVKVVYASSASVYGEMGCLDETKDAGARNSKSQPLNPYAWSKYVAEQYGLALFSNTNTSFISLRYFNVYGNGEAEKGRMASMIYHLFKEKEVAKLFPLNPQRDFVYIKDVVSATLHAAFKNHITGFYDVGTGKPREFEDIAKAMSLSIEYLNAEKMPKGYQFYTCAKIKLPLWKVEYSLEDGIADYRKYL